MASEEEIYQDHILDHYEDPFHRGHLSGATHAHEGKNPLCGDVVRIELAVDDEGKIRNLYFDGAGCVISQASASLMTMKLKGKSRTEVTGMLRAFHDLVTDETSEAPKTLGDLRVMKGVRKFPQRVKCAMLAWRAVEQAMEQRAGEATVSTEPA